MRSPSSTIASANFRPRGTRQDTVVGKRGQRAVGCPIAVESKIEGNAIEWIVPNDSEITPFPEISAAVLSSAENIAWMTHS